MSDQDNLPPIEDPENHKMTLIDHLDELRYRIFYCFIAISVGYVFAFIISRQLIDLLKLVAPTSTVFVQISPGEVFIVSLKIALYAAIYFASPVIFYQIVKFVSPGLKPSEKKYIIPIVIAAFLLFTLGIAFAYFAALPLAMNFLLGYGSDVAQNNISISRYISFSAVTIFLMGAVFQVPLLLVFLSIINIINSQKLSDLWKYVIIIAFVLGAILTPSPDPFGQVVVAVAILILYAASIAFIRLIGK